MSAPVPAPAPAAVQSPNGQPSMLPIPVVICNNCGTVHPKFTPKELIEDVGNEEG